MLLTARLISCRRSSNCYSQPYSGYMRSQQHIVLLTARLATCIQVIVLNGVRVFQWFSQMHVSNISRHCATCGVEECKGNETRKHMFNSRTSLYSDICGKGRVEHLREDVRSSHVWFGRWGLSESPCPPFPPTNPPPENALVLLLTNPQSIVYMHTDVLISRRPKSKQSKFKPNVIRVFTFNITKNVTPQLLRLNANDIHTYTHIYIHTYIYMQIFADDVDFQKQVLQLSVFLSVPWLQNFLWWPASAPSTYSTHYWLPANTPPWWLEIWMHMNCRHTCQEQQVLAWQTKN